MGFNMINPVQAKRSSGRNVTLTLDDPGGVEHFLVYTTPPGLIALGDRLPRTALRLYGVTHILPHTGQIAGFIIVCIKKILELTLIMKFIADKHCFDIFLPDDEITKTFIFGSGLCIIGQQRF